VGDGIELKHLRVMAGEKALVKDVSLSLGEGETVGLVGSSGCGKTMTALSLLGMVDLKPGVVAADLTIRVGGIAYRPWDQALGGDIRARDRAFHAIRGTVLGYLPQDAVSALDPVLRIGRQVRDAAALRTGIPDEDPRPWLKRAGLPDPERVERLYPHELSGGMAQRVVIAQALARGSRFLVADEPTSGLDPTVQRGILQEIRMLCEEGIGVLFITHDLRILPGVADRVLVMENGEVVEMTTALKLETGELESEPGRRLAEATRRVAGGRLG
jgi:ABC-type dipeptide/oligopeptide/nickel transport system ATPase component